MGESVGGESVGREERIAPGVSLRRDSEGKPESLRIAFMFRGFECRERLDLEPTRPNQQYAIRLRGEILNAIGRGNFNYADFFPDSPRAKQFGSISSGKTIGDLLDGYEALTAPCVEASTWLGYKKVIEGYLRPWWGTTRMRDLTPAMIRARLLAVPGISLKTARNILTPLSVALTRAVNDDELELNPLDRVNLEVIWPKDRKDTDWKPDPFTFEEMLAIFGACREGEGDYWRKAFGTGLRPSEQIALDWPRCDLIAQTVRIDRAEVMGLDGLVMKGPKTEAGNRTIPLTVGALEALQRQWERTGDKGGRVWLDVRYGSPWRGEQPLRKRFERILTKAEVRYRNPYQTRHTFASVQLAAGRSPLLVAKWMGHETTEMLERHYGRWIEQGQNLETRAALDLFFSHPSPTVAEIVNFRR